LRVREYEAKNYGLGLGLMHLYGLVNIPGRMLAQRLSLLLSCVAN